jgi:hypothetical protein
MVRSGPAGYRYTVAGALQLHVRQAYCCGIGIALFLLARLHRY